MDEYKEYLYERRSDRYKDVDPGDLTKQRAIRDKLQCKSFKWFMENVAFDLPLKYPPVEPPDFASGALQSMSDPKYCVDSLNAGEKGAIGLFSCANDLKRPQGNQFWALSWHKDIRQKHGSNCWDVSAGGKDAPVLLFRCHGSQGNQLWRYDPKNKWVMQGRNNRCLDFDTDTKKLMVNDCSSGNVNMKWEWGNTNHTALLNWDTNGAHEDSRR